MPTCTPSYPYGVQPHSVPPHSVCSPKTVCRAPKDYLALLAPILKVLITYKKENIMVDNIKNEESKINQNSVIQYSTFSSSLVDFYSAAGISPSVSIWGSAWVPRQEGCGKMLETFILY